IALCVVFHMKYGACDVLYGIVVAPFISELAWNRGKRSNGGAMSDRRRRGRRRRLLDEDIRNLRAAPRPIRLAPEFTHIQLDQRRILTFIAAALISIAAIGAFKLYETYANYAWVVDE